MICVSTVMLIEAVIKASAEVYLAQWLGGPFDHLSSNCAGINIAYFIVSSKFDVSKGNLWPAIQPRLKFHPMKV